eukprot:g43150.t1
MDFRKKGGGHAPIYISGAEVERVKSIKFLGVTITNNVSWTSHIDATVKKAQLRLFFLRRLRKFSMSIRTLTSIYRCTGMYRKAFYWACRDLICLTLPKHPMICMFWFATIYCTVRKTELFTVLRAGLIELMTFNHHAPMKRCYSTPLGIYTVQSVM